MAAAEFGIKDLIICCHLDLWQSLDLDLNLPTAVDLSHSRQLDLDLNLAAAVDVSCSRQLNLDLNSAAAIDLSHSRQ